MRKYKIGALRELAYDSIRLSKKLRNSKWGLKSIVGRAYRA